MRELEQQIDAIGVRARRNVAYYFSAGLLGLSGIAVLALIHIPGLRGLAGSAAAMGVAANPSAANLIGWALIAATAACYLLSRRRYI